VNEEKKAERVSSPVLRPQQSKEKSCRSNSEHIMYDPLFNPPPSERKHWESGLLLLIPLRLGLKFVNVKYFSTIKTCFRSPYSVGILGGRPNHAIYFVGYREHTLLGHDPHRCVYLIVLWLSRDA
jgi:hypothetical protein